MHEVIGHASGRQKEGLAGTPQALIKEHFSALEEGRADLIGLYWLPDPKLVELGIINAADHDAIVRAEYEAYTRNALVQLRRVREGTQIEEDHMRNRHMIVSWLMAHTGAIEKRRRGGKTYFVMTESSGLQSDLFRVEIPGYNEDLRRLGSELSKIWNAFLRGQIFIFVMSTLIYIFVLSIFGVRYAIGIAFLAGLAKFLPYIGPAITWVIMALVTFFQSPTPFGMQPLTYMLMVVITTTIIDWIIDNLITPRLLAQTLRVHPAAVLIVALILANLIGLLGLLIAAPVLASFTLLARYTMRKMFDLNPWPPGETLPANAMSFEWIGRTREYLMARLQRNPPIEKTYRKESSDEQQQSS